MDSHNNASRHSFDQPFSSNYKNFDTKFDCIDGGVHAVDKSVGIYHQPNCSLQNAGNLYSVPSNRYVLPATIPQMYSDHHHHHHYAQIGGFNRGGDNNGMGTCCHQNPHYECLNNFNSRSSHQKQKNGIDYSSFQSK